MVAGVEPYEVIVWQEEESDGYEDGDAYYVEYEYRALSSERFSSLENAEWYVFFEVDGTGNGATISKDGEVIWTFGSTPFPAL